MEFITQSHDDIDTKFKRGTVLAIIDSPNDREILAAKLRQVSTTINLRIQSEEKLKTLLRNYLSSYKLQSNQQEVVNEQVEKQLDWEKTLEKLAQIGWVPKNLYLQASSQVLGLRANLISANSQLISSLQSIQDSQQKLLQSDSDIKNDLLTLRVALFDYLNKAYLIAPTDLYVVNTSFRNEQTITEGSNAILYTTTNPRLPTYITTYFNAKQAAQIFPGMKALVTPSGVSRAQFGGIIGSVERVDTSPSSLEEITAQTGINEIGRLVNTSQSVPFRVIIKLQKVQKNQSKACNANTQDECYRWNSGEEPPFPTRLGNTVNVQVTTDTQTPVQLVIPVLRKFIGIATDA
jgi:HlyD family secretion protein